jgi:AcrR family transcriptional regulator
MTARAVAIERTATAILETAWELFADKAFADITPDDIAARSGVRTQTVLRRFGDKDAIFAAMFVKLGTDMIERRGRVQPNAIEDIVGAAHLHRG